MNEIENTGGVASTNLKSQVFKSDLIQEFKLKLSDGKDFLIPVRKDGYINVTLLCKASGKRIDNWMRLDSTKKLFHEFSNSLGSEGVRNVDCLEGKYGGTFIHPDLAIQIAQWCSPSFAIQVSRWVRELLLTGKVELGKEKSNEELENMYKEKLSLLENKLDDTNSQLESTKLELQLLNTKHISSLKRRQRSVYDKGNVIYLVSHEAFTNFYKTLFFKAGKAEQKKKESDPAFMSRLSSYNTCAPTDYVVEYLIYIEQNVLFEKMLLARFSKNLHQKNKEEWIKGVELEVIIDFIKSQCELLNFEYVEKVNRSELIDGQYKNLIVNEIENGEVEEVSEELLEAEELLEEEAEEAEEEAEEEVEVEILEAESKDENKISIEDQAVLENKRNTEILSIVDKCTKSKLVLIAQELEIFKTGSKEELLQRIKNRIANKKTCTECKGQKEMCKFRNTLAGRKKKCIDCETKSCSKEVVYRKIIKNEITPSIKTKKCSGCKENLSVEDFYKNKSRSDGYDYNCKNCETKRKNGENVILTKKRPTDVPVGSKWCPKCEITFPFEYFYKASKRPDGYQNDCKKCNNDSRNKAKLLSKIIKNDSVV